MKAQKAWMCMNELQFGAPIPHSFMALFKSKMEHTVLRKVGSRHLHPDAHR